MKIGWLLAGLALLLKTCHVEGTGGILIHAFNSDKPEEIEVVAEFTEQFNEQLKKNLAVNTYYKSVNLKEELSMYMIATMGRTYNHLEPDEVANVELPITAPQSDFMETLFPDGKYPMAKKALEYAFACQATGNNGQPVVGGYFQRIKPSEGVTDPEGKGRMVWEFVRQSGYRQYDFLNYLRQWKTVKDLDIEGGATYFDAAELPSYKLEMRKGKTDEAKRLEFLGKFEHQLRSDKWRFDVANVKKGDQLAKLEVVVRGFVYGKDPTKGILIHAFDPKKPEEKEVVAEFTELFNQQLKNSLALNTKLESFDLTVELMKYMIATIGASYDRLEPHELANLEMPITAPQSNFMEKLFPDGEYPMAKKALEYAFAIEATGNNFFMDRYHITIKPVEGATDPEGKDRMVWEYNLDNPKRLAWLNHPERLAFLNYLPQWKTATDVNIKAEANVNYYDVSRHGANMLEMRKGKTDEAKRLEFLGKFEHQLSSPNWRFEAAYVAGTSYYPATFEVVVRGLVVPGEWPNFGRGSDDENDETMRGRHTKKGRHSRRRERHTKNGSRSRGRRHRSKSKSKRSKKN